LAVGDADGDPAARASKGASSSTLGAGFLARAISGVSSSAIGLQVRCLSQRVTSRFRRGGEW